MTPTVTELLTPTQWQRRKRVFVIDPDGWRKDDKSWDDPITEAEFDRRAAASTVKGLGLLETR